MYKSRPEVASWHELAGGTRAAAPYLAGLAVLVGIVGCGDNSRDCGPGTVEEGGRCLPAGLCGFGTRQDPDSGECIPDGSVVCSNGTVFDPLTESCKIDPSACQNGTVLIDSACVDPTSELVIDVQEGPEPNGLGIIELSDAQAGNITLKATGAYVVHGTIDPWRDIDGDGRLEPDVDTYVVAVTAPTFVRVTADGVGGTAAGFVAVAAVADDDPLADWQRVGLSLVSDTSVREVFLPRAGTYHIAIADTRTLLEYVTTGGLATAAPGSNTSEYYVSLTRQPVPPATALPVTDGVASVQGALPSDKLAIYSVPLGNGLNTVRLAMPSALATGAFVVLRDDDFAVDARETSEPAHALVGDIGTQTLTRIVVDQAYTLLPTDASFALDVTVSNAPLLSRAGATVTAPATTNVGTDFSRLNLWAFDVNADDTTVGMQLAFSPAIVGQIYDSAGLLVASFTDPSSSVTWSSYRGLVRVPHAGRYYVATYAPSATAGATLSATSLISELTLPAVAYDTPLTAHAVSPDIGAAAFTYAASAAPWQQFDVTGINTGGQVASWFDPGVAYGRLDPLASSVGTLPSEVPPIFTHTFPAAGGAIGHVMLSDGTPSYLVTVNAVTPTTAPTVSLSFAQRAASEDLGTLTSGALSRTGQTIDGATPQRFYLMRTAIGKQVTITVTPTSNVNTQFRRLNSDETPLGALVNTSTNGPDIETFTQAGSEWTAFVVSSAGNVSNARTFDLTVSVQ